MHQHVLAWYERVWIETYSGKGRDFNASQHVRDWVLTRCVEVYGERY